MFVNAYQPLTATCSGSEVCAVLLWLDQSPAVPLLLEVFAETEAAEVFLGRLTIRAGAAKGRRAIAVARCPGALRVRAELTAGSGTESASVELVPGSGSADAAGLEPQGLIRLARGGGPAPGTVQIADGERLRLVSLAGDTGGGSVSGGPLSGAFAPEGLTASWQVDQWGPCALVVTGTVKGWAVEVEVLP